jgi:hypothetical protein
MQALCSPHLKGCHLKCQQGACNACGSGATWAYDAAQEEAGPDHKRRADSAQCLHLHAVAHNAHCVPVTVGTLAHKHEDYPAIGCGLVSWRVCTPEHSRNPGMAAPGLVVTATAVIDLVF